MIAEVVDVRADDDGRGVGLRDGSEDLEKLRLAPVTAVGIVARVVLARNLVRADALVSPAALPREIVRCPQLAASQRRRYGGDRQGPLPESLVRNVGEIRGVDATRVRDDHRTEVREQSLEGILLSRESVAHTDIFAAKGLRWIGCSVPSCWGHSSRSRSSSATPR